jgi:hypothetical protein
MSTLIASNVSLLNTRSDWDDWISSIEDLAIQNDVWKYCDPEGLENLVFTVNRPSESASRDMIQKYQSLLAIHDSVRKRYDKVSERINNTVCQEFRQHCRNVHTVREKLIVLAQVIQPTAKDQKHNLRNEFEKLKKGRDNTNLDSWLGR